MISYNGVSSDDIGLVVSKYPSRIVPAPDVKRFSAPGRNGDVILFDGSYQNVTQKYDVYLRPEFQRSADAVAAWLVGNPGYHLLTDDYNVGFYREAYVANSAEFINHFNRFGSGTISFSCKPQRYTYDGFTPVTITARSYEMDNPTGMVARPVIEIHGSGSGTLRVRDSNISISDIVDGMTIDSDRMVCYDAFSDTDVNPLITMREFPLLKPNDNGIYLGGGITSIIITPRWWVL